MSRLLSVKCLGFNLYFILSAPLVASASGTQHFWTGNDLHEKCIENNSIVLGYVGGAIDAYNLSEGLVSDTIKCMSRKVNLGQVRDIACKFVRENPEFRHLPASLMIARSMYVAFPCATDNNKKQ